VVRACESAKSSLLCGTPCHVQSPQTVMTPASDLSHSAVRRVSSSVRPPTAASKKTALLELGPQAGKCKPTDSDHGESDPPGCRQGARPTYSSAQMDLILARHLAEGIKHQCLRRSFPVTQPISGFEGTRQDCQNPWCLELRAEMRVALDGFCSDIAQPTMAPVGSCSFSRTGPCQ